MFFKHNAVDMLHGSLFKNILLFTLPIMLSNLLQLFFNAADLIVVGRFCGSRSVAAVGATTSIIHLLVNLFIGLSIGAGIAVANAFGAGDEEEIRKTVHTAIPTAFFSGAVLTGIGIAVSGGLLELMATPADIIGKSDVYLKIYFCGTVFTLLYNFGAAILRAVGNTVSPLLYLTAAGLVNIVLNILFVTVFHMDVAGVALATVISQLISALLVTVALMRRQDSCRLIWRKMRFHASAFRKIIHIGLPAGIQSVLFSFSNVIIQSSVNSFGSAAISGSAAAGNIEGFIWVLMDSFQQTVMNFIGQNIGAKKMDRVRRIPWICLLLVTVTWMLAGIPAYLFARPLLRIYITDSEAAIGYGVIRMTYIAFVYYLCGYMNVMSGTLRGLGCSTTPMVISIIGICLFRVVWLFGVFSIPAYHTFDVIFLSYPISWAFSLAAELIAYLIVLRHRMRRLSPPVSPVSLHPLPFSHH